MSIPELHKNGTMAFLVEHGYVTPTAYRRIELFVEVKELEHKGIRKTQAVYAVAQKCKVSENCVWTALRKTTH